MVKTIIEEIPAVSLGSADMTLAWQLSQVPHTRAATFTQVLTSMASLNAAFASVSLPTGALVAGPSTADFNALSASVTTTSDQMSLAETELSNIEARVAVLEGGGGTTGMTIALIPDQAKGATFTVQGKLNAYSVIPTLNYRDNAGSFAALPGSPTVTTTSYLFTHPAVSTATAGMNVTVRDANATTVTAVSNTFAIIDAAVGAPDPPTGLASKTSSGSSITVGFVPATTGTAIDAGSYNLQYKKSTATNWLDGPLVPTVTAGVGRFVDPAGNVWQITAGGQVSQTNSSGTSVDSGTSNVVRLMIIRNVVWYINNANNWFSTPYTTFPASWAGPITTSPLSSPGVRIPESGLGLAVNTAYNIRVAGANSNGIGAYSSAINASTATTDMFTTGSPIIRRPGGLLFQMRGISVRWLAPDGTTQQGANWLTNLATSGPLTTTFPGLNAVRVIAFSDVSQISSASFAIMRPYIDALAANGIVVVLGCATGTIGGSDLTDVSNWIADFAVYYAASPNVWFETPSRPTAGNAGNDAMLTAIYGAVRGADNRTMVMINSDVYDSTGTSGYDPTTLAGLYSVGWNATFFNRQANYSTEQSINSSALSGMMRNLSRISDFPIVIGEFGDSSDGTGIDPGWQEVVTAVYHTTGAGFLQSWWNTSADSAAGAGNQLLRDPFDGRYLTDAGERLRNAITSRATGTVRSGSSSSFSSVTQTSTVTQTNTIG